MITLIYDFKLDIKETVLEPVKFTTDAIYLNLFYHKITSDKREISDYVSFNKFTKDGCHIKIGHEVFEPAQILENPEHILALMKQDFVNQAIEELP